MSLGPYQITGSYDLIAERQNIDTSELSASTISVCSSTSKVVASVVTYPHEVIRTRLQINSGWSKSTLPSTYFPPSGSGSSLSSSYISGASVSSPSSHTSVPSVAPFGFRTILNTTLLVYQENGWRGLYRGLSVNLLQTVPNSVIAFITSVTSISLH